MSGWTAELAQTMGMGLKRRSLPGPSAVSGVGGQVALAAVGAVLASSVRVGLAAAACVRRAKRRRGTTPAAAGRDRYARRGAGGRRRRTRQQELGKRPWAVDNGPHW